jgi:tripartite-type tricarboxylate transporter receptor subunit TctC
MNLIRRHARAAALAGAIFGSFGCLMSAAPAAAADWPAQQVKFVLPYPPGGASDVTARLLGKELTPMWGQTVVVDNRPGANGIISSELVAKAAPDGYTVLMANLGPNGINPAVYSKLTYDNEKDFAPVILTTKVPLLVVVAENSPFKSLRDYMAAAKAKPNGVTFGSPGNGSGAHLAGELLASLSGVHLMHVPYKGDAPAMTDVLSGQIASAMPTALAGVPQVKSGKLRALAVTSSARIPSLPDVPTVEEALGLKGFEAVSWGGFMVPTGTAPAIVKRMNADINTVLKMPEVADKLRQQGAVIIGGTPEEFGRFIRDEIAKWKKVAQQAKVRLD